MKIYSSMDILRRIEKNGWHIEGQKGSHLQLKHSIRRGKITFPHPRKQLRSKTALLVCRLAGVRIWPAKEVK